MFQGSQVALWLDLWEMMVGEASGNICWVPRKQALTAFELTYLKNELDFIAYCFSDSFFICAFTQQK